MLGDYWIDAACSIQSGDEERTTHVQMMDHIYRGATRVVFWLRSLPPSSTSGPDESLKYLREDVAQHRDSIDWDD